MAERFDVAVVPDFYVEEVCRRGQGPACCSYLIFDNAWRCAKGTSWEAAINEHRPQMSAQGDNCAGWTT